MSPALIFDPDTPLLALFALVFDYTALAVVALLLTYRFIVRPLAVSLRTRVRQVRHRRRVARRDARPSAPSSCAGRAPLSSGLDDTAWATSPVGMADGVAPHTAADRSGTPDALRSAAFHHAGRAG